MKIIIGLICLSLIWVICEALYAPLVDNEDNIIDPNNDYDNIF